MVPVMVSLLVVFAMVELSSCRSPRARFWATSRWWRPLDGARGEDRRAAVASGAISEALLYADAAAQGIKYDRGWIVGTATILLAALIWTGNSSLLIDH
jgi:hypothetical protein